MKQNNNNATPAVRYIDGQPFVRVIDLGHMWHTNTSNILATGKPHHVPEEQLRRIDGRVWCSFQGLRYRVAATKHGSSIAGRISEFLDAQAEKTEPKPEPAATDLGTAALIADARRTASQALAKANEAANFAANICNTVGLDTRRIGKLESRMEAAANDAEAAEHNSRVVLNRLDELEHMVKASTATCRDHVARHQSASATVVSDKNTERIQELSGKLDRLTNAVHGTQNKTTDAAADAYAAKQTATTALDTATQAADLAQENADMITVTGDRISLRIDRLSEHVDKMRKKADARHDDTMARIWSAERNQRDTAARIATLEEHARAVDWTLAAVAVLGVVGRMIRLLHRR